jgi:hypothetical protein
VGRDEVVAAERGRVARALARLDGAVLGRSWDQKWLIVAAGAGLLLAVGGAIGFVLGGGAGSTPEPFALGVFLCGVSSSEIWSRLQRAHGRQPFARLRRLDDRFLKRR